ncbi:MAG: Hsp20/alpha crystallin family protein [Treponema sp.]|nr:Hsp20/alpha crystallin family protein [Treponema sp.]
MKELSLFDSLFNGAMDDAIGLGYRISVPKVDVTECKDCYNLEMELPGLTEKDVNIDLDRNVLTISSVKEEKKENDGDEKKAKDEEKNKKSFLIRERRTTMFSRSFTLPDDVDSEKVSAVFKNGILTVNMPRKETPSPKRIAIAAA